MLLLKLTVKKLFDLMNLPTQTQPKANEKQQHLFKEFSEK